MDASSITGFHNAFGAAFVGLLISTALWGVTISQTWIYYWNYHNRDSKAHQVFIAFITAMDAVHTILSAYSIYWYLIVNFDNIENLTTNIWALNAQTFFSIVIGVSVELYYARRVYKVSQSIICPIIIVVLVITSCLIGIFFAAKVTALKHFTSFHTLKWISCAGMIVGVLAELLVSTALCWSLYRKKTGFARTDSMITILMAYTINSGLLSCVFSVAVTVSFTVSPSSLIWLSLFWAMTKCQINSLLAMLNSRDYISDRPIINADTAYNLSSIRIEPQSEAYISKARQPGVSVTVHRTTASSYGLDKSDHDGDGETTFKIRNPDASTIILSQREGQMSE